MKRTTLISLISGMLVLLWVYAAASKLLDYEESRKEMLNQSLPGFLEEMLVWAIPLIEILTALLLLFVKTRLAGTLLSVILLFLFTCYIGLVKMNYFDYVPCSCGGVIGSLNWTEHLLFNLAFLIPAAISYLLQLQTPALDLAEDS